MRTDTAEISELLAHGGWLLDDVQKRHAENPDTFGLPAASDLDALRPGHMVQLVFQLLEQADPAVHGIAPYADDGTPQLVVTHERLWLWVEHRQGSGPHAEILGILDSLPWSTHTRLQPGARVRFRASDVTNLDREPERSMSAELERLTSVGFSLRTVEESLVAEDPDRAPSIAPSQTKVCDRAQVRPERPSLFQSRLLVGNNLNETSSVVFGSRFLSNPDRGDSGWMIWADHEDIEDPGINGYSVVDAAELQRRHPHAWKYLALPPGWSFTRGPNGNERLVEEPGLLAAE